MWSNVVEETGEPGENHRTWTGDHYPATCLDPDSNPDRRGDKRVRYPLRYPGPPSSESQVHLLRTPGAQYLSEPKVHLLLAQVSFQFYR